MNKAEITVLMSCFNAAQYLEEAIRSILSQSYKDFEFILINDGSTDDTFNIIKQYAANDNRIVVIDKENTGLTDSLNRGIHAAGGKWIARMDADDLSMPDRFEKQVKFIQNNPEIVLLGSWCIEIDREGSLVKKHEYAGEHKRLVHNLKRLKHFFPHSSVFMKREAIEKVGLYNPLFKRSQDWDMWLRLSEVGRISCCPEYLMKLRKHEESVSYGNFEIFGIAAIVCYFLREQRSSDPSLSEKDVWERFMMWLSNNSRIKRTDETRRVWKALRQKWYADTKNNAIGKITQLASGAVGSKQLMALIKQIVFGYDDALRVANEWIKYTRA